MARLKVFTEFRGRKWTGGDLNLRDVFIPRRRFTI